SAYTFTPSWTAGLAMQFLQYNLTHPYPKNKLFTAVTFVLIALTLPILIILNIITVGHELVPALQQDFQQNDTIPLLWTTTLLAPLLRRKAPLCQPKDFGRGDTFRLSPSLFEYKVLSSWRTSSTLKSKDEGRVEYRGGSFDQCYVYSIRFDLSVIESTQTLTVVVSCPDFPVRAFMESRIIFALDDSKDIVGQYYGGDLDILDLVDGDSRDYRRLVFAIMDVMSTDSLSILDGSRHNWLSLSTLAKVDVQEPSFSTAILVAKNESTQTLTVVVSCPDFPVRAFMESRIIFALDDSKDIVGQYYGGDLDILDLVDGDSRDYRRLVFAIMDVMSTDSLSILDGSRHNWLSLSTLAKVDVQEPSFSTAILVAKNGTSHMLDNELGDAEVYRPTIVNLMRTVQHAVQLDLGNPGPANIFTNASAINSTFSANPPFAGFDLKRWVNRNSFQYGKVEAPYLTFAEMLRAGFPTNITRALGDPTGLPAKSTIITSYMCPNYQARPKSSLVANVFIGTATMFLSAWAALRFVTAMIAKRIRGPCVTCTCGGLTDLENTLMRCDHSHAVVASGLATGLVPPPNFLARSNTESDINQKGDFSSQDISIQEVPKTGPVVEAKV
ncbi:unnamed protein product, partial [Rhizoctonia solani]